MPRKTKETNEEKNTKKQSKLNEKINALIKNVLEPEVKTTKTKTTAKKAPTKKEAKEVKPVETEKKVKKAATKTKAEKTTTKKVAKAKDEKKSKEEKPAKKTTKTTKETPKTEKKATTKTTTRKTTTKKATKTASKETTSAEAKSTKVASPTNVEYYDLPYKYNQTVVKVLYQNPTTLFVYWEISDSDIENYKATYGENFFETTRPVLVVYNDTMHYHFDVDINDFANSWYFTINDSKCDYRVELIRRPVFYNEKIKTEYIHITSSNKIESPNDRILFSTDEPYTVYFRNTKNNMQRKVNLPKLLEQLNLANKKFGFPLIRNVYDLYKNIYRIDDVGEFSIDLTNPSSRGGNPSSHSLSSRFM